VTNSQVESETETESESETETETETYIDKKMMMTPKKSNGTGRIPKLEKEFNNRIVGHEMVQLDQLLAHPNNWRLHPKYQQDALAGLIDDIGFIRSVLVNKTTGTVIDGHLRVALASRSGVHDLPVEYVELTEEQELKALALLDPIASMAGTDKDKLEEILAMVTADNDRVLNAIASVADRYQIQYNNPMKSEMTDPEEFVIKKDELQKKWQTKLGQTWYLGNHRLICGDCLDQEIVDSILGSEKVDQLLTDPPYGVDLFGNNKAYYGKKKHKYGEYKNDNLNDYRSFYGSFLKIIPFQDVNTVYIYTGGIHMPELCQAMSDAGIHRSQEVIWVKNTFVPGFMDYWPQHEIIIYGWKGKHIFYRGFTSSIIDDDFDPEKLKKEDLIKIIMDIKNNYTTILRHNKPSASIYHPTTKPIPVIEKFMLDGSDYGSIIYEPFLGSGTTLLAAEMHGRKCRAIELDPGYVAVALERWQGLTNQEPSMVDRFTLKKE